jgi:hypothetical protein
VYCRKLGLGLVDLLSVSAKSISWLVIDLNRPLILMNSMVGLLGLVDLVSEFVLESHVTEI